MTNEQKIKSLVIRLEVEMEEGWCAEANYESPDDNAYMTIAELQELGLGAVLVPNKHGRMKWLDLETAAFHR